MTLVTCILPVLGAASSEQTVGEPRVASGFGGAARASVATRCSGHGARPVRWCTPRAGAGSSSSQPSRGLARVDPLAEHAPRRQRDKLREVALEELLVVGRGESDLEDVLHLQAAATARLGPTRKRLRACAGRASCGDRAESVQSGRRPRSHRFVRAVGGDLIRRVGIHASKAFVLRDDGVVH